MKLPETQNANHLYAFKKGYRLAMEGRPLSHMPSQIKLEPVMRDYFEQGWQQYQDDLAEATENDSDSPWRNKVVWTLMAVLAGLATASLMIHNIEQEKQDTHSETVTTQIKEKAPDDSMQATAQLRNEDFGLISSNTQENATPQPETTTKSTTNSTPDTSDKDTSPEPNSDKESDNMSLSLLSDDERMDLASAKQKFESSQQNIPLSPLVKSKIIVSQAVLTDAIKDMAPQKTFSTNVPKYIRKIYFFSKIENAKGQEIYHQWRYNGKVMATIRLKIDSDRFRTWSSKRLSSAWSGDWTVEVLNQRKQPIFRKTFKYSQ